MIPSVKSLVSKPVVSFQNKKEPKEIYSDQSINDKLQELKAKLGRSNNPRALNLYFLAEAALKNGNTFAAGNFADRAMDILAPQESFGLNKKILSDFNEKQHAFKPAEQKKPKETKHTYKDVSSDAGVSFSYPSSLSGAESFFAVPAHEGEHVGKRVREAVLNGDQIMVMVSYRIRYDPNSGEAYMAGGETRTITFSHHKMPEKNLASGHFIDVLV